MEVITVTREEYDKIVRGEAVEKDGKIIQFDPVGEVHKPTKEQIKEALDAVKEYCGKYPICADCKLYDVVCGGARHGTRFPQGWDAKEIEKAAEVIANERG